MSKSAVGKCDTFAPPPFNETSHEQAPQRQAGCPRGRQASPARLPEIHPQQVRVHAKSSDSKTLKPRELESKHSSVRSQLSLKHFLNYYKVLLASMLCREHSSTSFNTPLSSLSAKDFTCCHSHFRPFQSPSSSTAPQSS